MKRGHKAAAAMGEYLATLKPAPALVLCSTALRTRETLDRLAPSLHGAPRILFEEALYLASARQLLERLQRLPESVHSVLLIGHNPGLHQLAMTLASESNGLAESFPTAALAVLRIAESWAELHPRRAKLIDYRTPKSLSRDPDFAVD